MTLAETYRTIADRFGAVVEAVPDAGWAAPSPCAGWSAADVVDHVVTTEREFLERVGLDAPDVEGLDRPAAWRTVRGAVEAVLDGPDAEREYDGHFGRTTVAATIGQFYVPDLVIHRWDLARATGQTAAERIDEEESRLVRDALSPLGDSLRQPGVFGPARDVPDDADEQTRLLAFAGRDT